MSETPMNKLRALCEKWESIAWHLRGGLEHADPRIVNAVASESSRVHDKCAAELRAILPDMERLETENIQIRKFNDGWREQNHKDRSEYREELREVYKTVERLVEALGKYGGHIEPCRMSKDWIPMNPGWGNDSEKCTCGFDTALALFDQPVAPKETK